MNYGNLKPANKVRGLGALWVPLHMCIVLDWKLFTCFVAFKERLLASTSLPVEKLKVDW